MEKKITTIGVSCIVILIVLIMISQLWQTRPFKNLSASEVESITTSLRPAEITIELNNEQIETAISLLNEIIIYQRGYVSDATTGQVVDFVITKHNDYEINVSFLANTTLILNNTRYRVKYKASEKLNAFANSLKN